MKDELTVEFVVHQGDGAGGLTFSPREVTLPRPHALVFAQVCYLSDGLFSLKESFLKQLTLPERAFVEAENQGFDPLALAQIPVAQDG